jgi:uncharacterized protein (TIGR04255 family)
MTGDSRAKFKNPPVIEAWVEFRFSFKDEIPYWNEVKAQAFITDYFEGRFHVDSFLGRTEFTISASGGRPALTQSKVIFERVRATNEASDRYVQVGRDTLIYNLLRKEKDWPEYHSLRDEAIDAYDKFIQFLRPMALQYIALHYRDLVIVPLQGEQKVRLEDYFTICPEVPEHKFGDMSNFMVALTLPETWRSGVLNLIVQSDPPVSSPEHPNEGRFRWDWHISPKSSIGSLDKDIITSWLDQAHDDLFQAFLSAFTQKGLELFK